MVKLRSKMGSGSIYGDAQLETLMTTWIERYLTPLRDPLEWVSNETEIAPGLIAIDAPGHTPGHVAIAIWSGSNSLVYAADSLILPAQVAAPSWTTLFDLDPQTLIATRERLLDRCATDRSVMFHYHFGGVGAVRRRGAHMVWETIV
jgi:glyoxylase-like metal-dependent hydrolase (beta-lactamase superfamily II)